MAKRQKVSRDGKVSFTVDMAPNKKSTMKKMKSRTKSALVKILVGVIASIAIVTTLDFFIGPWVYLLVLDVWLFLFKQWKFFALFAFLTLIVFSLGGAGVI